MGNQYFKFKQFTVNQDRCGMKVTTDACLFGAWVSRWLSQNSSSIFNSLDIGTGTGLLSLMVAQNNSCIIDAVEIEASAFEQATNNFKESPWSNRLKVVQSSIQDFHSPCLYDFIFTNPPFFDNDLLSSKSKKNIALHSTHLSFQELIIATDNHLSPNGSFAILLPYHRLLEFEMLTKKYFVIRKALIRQTPLHQYFRAFIILSKVKIEHVNIEEIIIADENKEYTSDFINLLSPYYLRL